MSQETDKSSSNWKVWAGAGAAAVAAIGGYLYFSSAAAKGKVKKSKKRSSKKKGKETNSAAATPSSSTTTTTATKPTARKIEESKVPARTSEPLLFPEDDLLQCCAQSVYKMQSASRGSIDDENTKRLLAFFSQLQDFSRYSPRARLFLVQWLILYHTIFTMLCQTAEALKKANDAQKEDMKKAWEILDVEFAQEEEKKAGDLLRLDVAQRLRDGAKLQHMFDKVKQSPNLKYEELVVLFTTAPLVGRWKETRELGDKIVEISRAQDLSEFHLATLNRKDIPDYSVLYEQAADEPTDATLDDIKYAVYEFESLKVRLNNVEANSDQEAAELRSTFEAQTEDVSFCLSRGLNFCVVLCYRCYLLFLVRM